MKRSSVRAFGIALFLIGALYIAIDQFHINLESIGIKANATNSTSEKKLEKELKDAKEKIELLEKQLKESNTKTQSNNSGNNSDLSQTSTSDKSEEAVTYTLEIYRNISTYNISEKLEDAGIIDNAREFELLLAKDEYARRLQIGTYNVNSNMTMEEIATMITKTNTIEQ